MASVGLIFDPSDLNYGHISNVILRTVQLSLTPRIHSGRGDVLLVPKFVQRFYRDAIPVFVVTAKRRLISSQWLRYSLEVKGFYPGKVPQSVMAIIFPKGAKPVRYWYASGLVGIDFLFGADMFPPDEQDKCRAQRS